MQALELMLRVPKEPGQHGACSQTQLAMSMVPKLPHAAPNAPQSAAAA